MFKKLNHKFAGNWWYDEAHSAFASLMAFLLIDGYMQLLDIYNGNFTKETFVALGVIVVRSCLKVILERIGFSPKRSS